MHLPLSGLHASKWASHSVTFSVHASKKSNKVLRAVGVRSSASSEVIEGAAAFSLVSRSTEQLHAVEVDAILHLGLVILDGHLLFLCG